MLMSQDWRLILCLKNTCSSEKRTNKSIREFSLNLRPPPPPPPPTHNGEAECHRSHFDIHTIWPSAESASSAAQRMPIDQFPTPLPATGFLRRRSVPITPAGIDLAQIVRTPVFAPQRWIFNRCAERDVLEGHSNRDVAAADDDALHCE